MKLKRKRGNPLPSHARRHPLRRGASQSRVLDLVEPRLQGRERGHRSGGGGGVPVPGRRPVVEHACHKAGVELPNAQSQRVLFGCVLFRGVLGMDVIGERREKGGGERTR